MGKTIETFYDMDKYLHARYEELGRKLPMRCENAATLTEWQSEARARLRKLLCLDELQACAPQPQKLESEDFGTHLRERWIMQTEPDVWMPFFLLRPKDMLPGERRPAMLLPPGHGPGKFGTVDAFDYDGMGSRQERALQPGRAKNFALDLVEHGYLVFANDTRGAGERREWMTRENEPEMFGNNSHYALSRVTAALGLSLTGMMIWDLMRLYDFAASLLECDGRIGCGGMSGGGQQTIFYAALEPRLQCALTSGWFYGFEQSLLELSNNCSCNYVPGLWRWFDCRDIGAMIAPTPLWIENGENDHLNGRGKLDNVYPQVNATREAYAALGAQDNLWHVTHGGVHEWRGIRALEFVNTYMPLKAPACQEARNAD